MARSVRFTLSLLLIGLLFGFVSQRPTVVAPPTPTAVPPNLAALTTQPTADGFTLIAENETFQLYANGTTLAFRVVDKRSGYVWHSNLDEKREEDRLNRTWTAFADSGLSIDYLDDKAVSERASNRPKLARPAGSFVGTGMVIGVPAWPRRIVC